MTKYTKKYNSNCELEEVCAERDKLEVFKKYFDDLYGQGLEIANWHYNGDLEPFDNFYESALDEMESN